MKRKLWILAAAVLLLAVLWCGISTADCNPDLITRQSPNEQMEVGRKTTFWVDVDGNDNEYYYQWHIGYAEVTLMDPTVFHEAAQGYAAGTFFVPTDKDSLEGWRNHAVFTDEHDSMFEITPTDDALSGTYLYCAVWSKEVGRDSNGVYTGVGDYAYSAFYSLSVREDVPYLTAGNETGTVWMKVGLPQFVSVNVTKEYYYEWTVCDDEVRYEMSEVQRHATVENAGTRSIKITPLDTWLNGKQIYCTVAGTTGKIVYSPTRDIRVSDSLITVHPGYQITYPKGTFTYSVCAPAAVSYEWRILQNNAELSPDQLESLGMAEVSEAVSNGWSVLTFTPAATSTWMASSAYLFCTVTDANGNTEISTGVKISYDPEVSYDKIIMKQQPDSVYRTEPGSPFTASVSAVKTYFGRSYTYTQSLKYDWHITDTQLGYDPESYDWSVVREHAEVSGENTSQITLTPRDAWLNGKYLYCDAHFIEIDEAEGTFTTDHHRYSDFAKIRVLPAEISLENQGAVTVTSASGQNNAGELLTAELSGGVATMAGHLTYQWQSRADNGNWTNMGNPERTGNVRCPFSYAGKTVRVRVTADGVQGSLESVPIRLNQPAVGVSVYIPRKESGYTYCVGEQMIPVVTAEDGLILYYQWQRSADGYDWQDITDAATLIYTPTAADVGKLVRVQVSAAYHEGSVPSNDYVIDEPAYTVTFDMQGHGTQISPGRVQNGNTLSAPSEPEETGWTFGGWYTDYDLKTKFSFDTPITEDLTLHAWWGHKVNFNLNGKGQGWRTPGTQKVHESGTARMPSLYQLEDYEGWYIRGWYKEQGCVNEFDFTQPVTEDMLLYAGWEYDGYVVLYDWNGNHEVTRCRPAGGNSMEIIPDQEVALRVRTGSAAEELIPLSYEQSGYYVCAGWYTEPACVNAWDFTATVTKNMTLYARWEHNNSLTVHKITPSGTDAVFRYTVAYGAAPAEDPWISYLLNNHDTWEGWSFAGWFTDEDCTVPFDPEAIMTESVHIYRKWVKAPCRMTFDANGGVYEGGATEAQILLHYGDAVTAPEEAPVREGYTLLGWNTGASDLYPASLSGQTCAQDMTWYAVWALDGGIPIDYAHFHQSDFRAFVKDTFDLDKDNYLSPAEIEAVTEMNIRNRGFTELHGISNFYNLRTLDCSNNQLTSVYHVREMPMMKTLDCSQNQISGIELYGLPELETLNCSGNSLEMLNLTDSLKLIDVDASGNSGLVSLQIRGRSLKALRFHGTGLNSVNISGCPLLCEVADAAYFTELEDRDRYMGLIGGISRLIDCSRGAAFVKNELPVDEAHFPDAGFRKTVDVFDLDRNGCLSESEMEGVTSLFGSPGTHNIVGSHYFPGIDYVSMNGTGLESMDLSGNLSVGDLYVSDNALTALDVSMLPRLCTLEVNDNPGLETLTLGAAPLETLKCYHCPLIRSLDLSLQPHLLKAYLEGGSWRESGGYMLYAYEAEGESGFLYVDRNVDVALPVWEWNGTGSAKFILPNGTEYDAEITRDVSADRRTVTYTAGVNLSGAVFRDSKTYYLVTFANTDISAQELNAGDRVAWPENPFKAGSVFDGWYADPFFETEYVYDGSPVSAGFTVYARWITPDAYGFLKLPDRTRTIESEAFRGIPAGAVIVPRTVNSIAHDAFAGSGIRYVYGYPGTRAETFADAYGYTFVPIDDAWMAGR